MNNQPGVALITGADRGLGYGLTESLLKRGWEVFAGQFMPRWPELSKLAEAYPERLHIIPLNVAMLESVQAAFMLVSGITDHLDLLINNAGISARHLTIREPQDYAEMHRVYDVNSLGPLRVVETFLPLLDKGTLKRLCFVSSEAGSIAKMYRKGWFAYTMSKAALNMAVHVMFNSLREEGYTFRLYHPGWVRSFMAGAKNTNADLEPDVAAEAALPFFLNPREDEDHLVLVDYQGQEWPW
jgi:NAD(P)-dependent dehydrogenase (short-subunit alcohol dehydrogenase family)